MTKIMEEIKKMNVNGIGAGYPAAGYETRRARRNYSDQMCNMVPATQSSGGTFELHISNDKDGKAIGSMCGADYSLTVYQPNDFDPANPVYKVKAWDKDGNETERMVDVSKVDTKNSDYIDMFAYSSHLSASGKCPGAQSAFIRAGANQHGADNRTHDDLFGMKDWISVLKDAMQTQYDAGNLKGYLDYKQFWDFLEK